MSFAQVGNIKGPQPWTTPPVPWAANTAYTANAPASVVTYQGATYVCSTTHTSGTTFAAPNWTLVAASGSAGTPGTPGAAGARGSVWTTGSGPPVASGTNQTGDMYLDVATGNVWQF